MFWARAILATALISSLPAMAADSWPSKSIRLIVPAAAGGSTDIGARIVAKLMSAELGQPVIVDNKGGGGGRVGAQEAARATPDGYTLIYANSITHALLPATSKSLAYDPFKNFAPVGGVLSYATMIACNTQVPFDDLRGMIAYAKAKPEALNMATAGPGSGNHFSSELLAQMAGIKVKHIPYKGNAPATQDVIGGVADCIHMTEVKPYVDAGKLKLIATTGLARDPRFPNVPTVDESGLKGYDATWWQGVFAPAGTPPAVIQRLSRAVRKAAEDPSLKAAMFDVGFVPAFVTPIDLTKRMHVDIKKFKKIAAEAGLELE
jgi:tripartite-type tricarboxylate transporter receptor subunit TctC